MQRYYQPHITCYYENPLHGVESLGCWYCLKQSLSILNPLHGVERQLRVQEHTAAIKRNGNPLHGVERQQSTPAILRGWCQNPLHGVERQLAFASHLQVIFHSNPLHGVESFRLQQPRSSSSQFKNPLHGVESQPMLSWHTLAFLVRIHYMELKESHPPAYRLLSSTLESITWS